MSSSVLVIVAQICVSVLLGAAIGLERELDAQSAGLRTHILVCLGSTIFTLAGAAIPGSDPTRIAAQVVTGIGFLGGGAILREGVTVRGLTTAASLWVTAAIGLSIGLRQWLAGIGGTLGALFVLWLLKYVERQAIPRRRTLEITLTLEPDAHMDGVTERAASVLEHSRVLKVSYGATGQSIMFAARPQAGAPITAVGERLRALDGVRGVEISR